MSCAMCPVSRVRCVHQVDGVEATVEGPAFASALSEQLRNQSHQPQTNDLAAPAPASMSEAPALEENEPPAGASQAGVSAPNAPSMTIPEVKLQLIGTLTDNVVSEVSITLPSPVQVRVANTALRAACR